jgi:hypothetical protein
VARFESATVGRVVFIGGWATFGAILLSLFDSSAAAAAAKGSFETLGLLFFGLVVLLFAGWGARRIVDGFAESAGLLSSVVPAGFAFPCVVRALDLPLTPSAGAEAPLYSDAALAAIACATFVATFALQKKLRDRAAAPLGSAGTLVRPDRLLFGLTALAGVLLVVGVAASLARPTLEERSSATPETHARVTVPPLDATFGEERRLVDDDTLVLTVVRSEPLPKQLARLTLDLRDGLGPRAVGHVVVGGGEPLAVVKQGLLWEVHYERPEHPKHYQPVVLGRFLSGSEAGAETPRLSAIRGQFAPDPGVVTLTGLAFLVALAEALLEERRRRRAKEIAGGKEGVLQPTGLIESEGELFSVEGHHLWTGPVVILEVTRELDPYRGVRAARRVLQGKIEDELRRRAVERREARARVVAVAALWLGPAIAAGVIGQWGL